ncbi:DUF1631 family protein [Ramlibacter albus]|uniref:DUF1631 family protein n=1 Tax=Ramlibacter albus TaxID=2079448 RepID=A0A923M7P5_9BURK|nr:DUF1631 family protein [Ramlibacter albus]MBC5764087.1 DUF1631 family protein [Ramlibacter albus]
MPLPAVVQPCLDRAVQRASSLVYRAGTEAAEALQKDSANRDAVRDLLRRLPSWRTRFADVLRRTIETTEPEPQAAAPQPGALSLSLVDDNEVVQNIEASRLAQQMAGRVEKQLAELNALMSSALGLQAIRPERNPLRPEVLANALRKLLGEDDPHPDWPGLWMRAMTDVFTEEVGQLYAECSGLLLKSGVQAAGYRLVNTPSGAKTATPSRPAPLREVSRPAPLDSRPAPLGAGVPSGPVPAGLAQAINAFMQFAGQALRGPFVRDFLANDTPHLRQALPSSYYERLQQELDSLQDGEDEAPYDPHTDAVLEAIAPVERPQRDIGTNSPLTRGAWGDYGAPRQRAIVRAQLKSEAREVGQAMGVDLVCQLVDQVAQDPRLLSPVREAMVALEPALGRLAVRSPRFAGDAESPARKLLEQVAQRSLRYNDQFSPDFERFYEAVRQRFNELNAQDGLQDAVPFEDALKLLQGEWHEQDAEEESRRQELLNAVQTAEKRQEEADRIAWELGQRSDLEGVPGVVQDFLYERWALVMAHARAHAKGGELDPGGYVAVITDLLWSVKRETALRDPAKAFELIPRVVGKLRAGLTAIGQPPGDDDIFFKALERLHRPVLKLRAKHRRQASDTAASVLDALPDEDLKPASAQVPKVADDIWLAPNELKACGFGDTEHAYHKPKQPDLSAAEADNLLARLEAGSWIDLYSRQHWHRAQLDWVNAKGTLFMFVSHGGRPHSMTRRSLQRLLCSRMVRPVAAHQVVQHAIDTLAQPRRQPLAA